MGLPEINIVFRSLAVSAIERSERGIVALVVKDSTATKKSYTFKKFAEVMPEDFTNDIYDYIRLAFLGNPTKVIVEVINETNERTINTVLKDLQSKKFNYLAVPGITSEDTDIVSSWIVDCREEGKMYKAVLPNVEADNEAIINFATTGIKVGEKSYTTEVYCARIAGILAGLPLTRSATYFVLDEVDEITEHEDPDASIDAGKLILVNDGVKIKIGRGVNSLKTIVKPKGNEFKKIKIVEAMDMIYEDIRTTFEDEYVGKVLNSYDNKVIFLTAVNAYFKQLQKDGVLDPNNDAIADIDVDAQELYLNKQGINTDDMNAQDLREANTGSTVFFKANVKPLDAMEDLEFNIYI